MSEAFRVSSEGITAIIGEDERRILQAVFASVIAILEPSESEDSLAALVGWDEDVELPSDPALLRLLPNGIEGDEDEALELRRLTERSIRQSKIGALRAASLMLEAQELALSRAQAELLARALNDVRIVFSERLGLHSAEQVEALHRDLESEETAEATDHELRTLLYFVGAVQNGVVQALLADLDQQKPEGAAG